MTATDPAQRTGQWLLLIAVPVLVFGVLYCAPVCNLLRLSFATFDTSTGLAHGFRLDRYAALLDDGYFLAIVWRTVRLSLVTTLASPRSSSSRRTSKSCGRSPVHTTAGLRSTTTPATTSTRRAAPRS